MTNDFRSYNVIYEKVYYLKAEFTVNGEHSWLFQNTGS